MADQIGIAFKMVFLSPAEESVIQSALGRWSNPPAVSVLQKLKSADSHTVTFEAKVPDVGRSERVAWETELFELQGVEEDDNGIEFSTQQVAEREERSGRIAWLRAKLALAEIADCISCGEGMSGGDCPESKRPCGHHCNCSWVHDRCHWCNKEFGGDC